MTGGGGLGGPRGIFLCLNFGGSTVADNISKDTVMRIPYPPSRKSLEYTYSDPSASQQFS